MPAPVLFAVVSMYSAGALPVKPAAFCASYLEIETEGVAATCGLAALPSKKRVKVAVPAIVDGTAPTLWKVKPAGSVVVMDGTPAALVARSALFALVVFAITPPLV